MIRDHTLHLNAVDTQQLTRWMKSALAAGVQAGENPFGAAIFAVDGTQVVAANNTVNSTNNPAAHAEVNAIADASRSLGRSDLGGYWLLATAEPCPMCLSAAVIAGIRNIAFGANQVVVNEAGYGGLGICSRELANQFNCEIVLRGSILGNDCVRFLLNNRKPN
ncbi:nucleoside deaminase [Allorhodopirellula heiligendammensis]|uniref:Guanine deaminase n=1 Tax=Allorhodopirellula heiligendammensis TaxID=2714739 RepID=A0A5C6BF39_9BACT|nr:nucleoside deaminase [Allorhodopirellula heiligendammensis]TWU10111.1 Guanine deaminase [Allorhodopirellula heiligendammensis]